MQLYHGTSSYIDSWNFLHSGECTGDNAGGIYFTDDKTLARSYSVESYIRAHGNDGDNENLQDLAEQQAHIYSCEIDTSNCLHLPKELVTLGNSAQYFQRSCDINSPLVNAIVATVLKWQGIPRRVSSEAYYEEQDMCEASEILSEYFEEYDEELDEYVTKDVYYNCICLHDVVDSCTDLYESMADTYIVLDTDIIKSTELITC